MYGMYIPFNDCLGTFSTALSWLPFSYTYMYIERVHTHVHACMQHTFLESIIYTLYINVYTRTCTCIYTYMYMYVDTFSFGVARVLRLVLGFLTMNLLLFN